MFLNVGFALLHKVRFLLLLPFVYARDENHRLEVRSLEDGWTAMACTMQLHITLLLLSSRLGLNLAVDDPSLPSPGIPLRRKNRGFEQVVTISVSTNEHASITRRSDIALSFLMIFSSDLHEA